MSRPIKAEALLIKKRNELILSALKDGTLNQSDVATIFRLPRNTVCTIKKHHDAAKS